MPLFIQVSAVNRMATDVPHTPVLINVDEIKAVWPATSDESSIGVKCIIEFRGAMESQLHVAESLEELHAKYTEAERSVNDRLARSFATQIFTVTEME